MNQFISTNKGLIIILLVVAILRFYVLNHTSLTFYSDDAIYAILARFLIEGNWQNFFHPTWQPLFPAFSAIFYFLFKNWELSLRLVSVISGVLLIIPLFYLIKRVLSFNQTTFFLLTITLFYPLIIASLVPLSDMLAVLLITSTMVAIFFAINNINSKFFILGGVMAGFSFLTRSEGTMFAALTFVYLVCYFLWQSFKQKKLHVKGFKGTFLFLILFFIIISPYLIATKTQLGYWTLSQKFSAQVQQWHAFALRPNGTTWSQEVVSAKAPNYKSFYFKGGREYIMENQDWFVWWFGEKLGKWKNLFLQLFPIWSIPLIILGLVSIVKNKFRGGLLYFIFISGIAIPATIFTTAVSDPRYLLWTLPFLMLFFYLGVNTLSNFLTKKAMFTAFLPFILSLFFPLFSWQLLTSPRVFANEFTKIHQKDEIIEAGKWIKKNSPRENPKILGRHEGIEFYSGGQTIYLPQQLSYEELLKFARQNRVDYLVAWVEELTGDKDLAGLLNSQTPHPGLKPIFQTQPDNPKLIIYTFDYLPDGRQD